MSFSGELEFVYEDVFSLKKQRHRACDMCRRMKRNAYTVQIFFLFLKAHAGDGKMLCSHCVKYGTACTYVQPTEPRSRPPKRSRDEELTLSPKDADYVETLKQRLKAAEAALQNCQTGKSSLVHRALQRLAKPFPAPHPEDDAFDDIADSFRTLSLDNAPADQGFQGKSSAAMLVKVAVSVRPNPASMEPICRGPKHTTARPWTAKPWQNPSVTPHHDLIFPDDYLMESLISHYFAHVNLFLPVLHRPLFLESTQQKLHLNHYGFASILLLVCALGSLYLTDASAEDRQHLAWQWYDQVELCGHSLRQQPTLYDLQAYCLAAQFLHCTSNPRACWSIVGFGLRLSEDIGAHRHKSRTTTITAAQELEKRAMWILLMLDTHLSGALGRARSVNQRDMDIVLPCDCNDEYWEPWGPGRQPEDRPSTISFFISALKLTRLMQFTLSTLYCNRTDGRVMGLTDLKAVTTELDSALSRWFTQVPDHLVWDPETPEVPLSDHAASLACFYHYTRILIHRSPLSALPVVPLDAPARDICAKAARACIRVADTHRHRSPTTPLMFSQSPVFTAGMILVLNMIGNGNTSERYSDTAQDLAFVRMAIEVLESQRQRWPSSGFFVTVLERLISSDYATGNPLNTRYCLLPPQAGEDISSLEYGGAIQQQFSANPNLPPPLMQQPPSGSGNAGQTPIGLFSRTPGLELFPPTFVGDEQIIPGRFHEHRFVYSSI
ncbi:Zn(2)-C6 fungal-type domain-containing protein [Mycena venus]|uniref:Zn(2)-C6 fungal-type domain-containing protein n=1 Tax=Mycena venus TaxID=2733690 RepID=A0A8H7D1F3_9AGAR|nr:Zn(2)-C6 fungal-type domain-containing protein [Mycena venus]